MTIARLLWDMAAVAPTPVWSQSQGLGIDKPLHFGHLLFGQAHFRDLVLHSTATVTTIFFLYPDRMSQVRIVRQVAHDACCLQFLCAPAINAGSTEVIVQTTVSELAHSVGLAQQRIKGQDCWLLSGTGSIPNPIQEELMWPAFWRSFDSIISSLRDLETLVTAFWTAPPSICFNLHPGIVALLNSWRHGPKSQQSASEAGDAQFSK